MDNCCFNRPYDDQGNLYVLLETESKLFVQRLISTNEIDLIWSFVLDYENNDNPFEERKQSIGNWKKLAVLDCDYCNEIVEHAEKLSEFGLKPKDASHIACAIFAKAGYFLTTDKKILNKNETISEISIINPVEFVRRYLDEQ